MINILFITNLISFKSILTRNFLFLLLTLSLNLLLQYPVLFSQLFRQFNCWLLENFSLFRYIEMKRSQVQHGWFCGFKMFFILFLVIVDYRSTLFIDKVIITLFCLTGLDSLFYPSFELEFRSIVTTIKSKFIILFTLPELFWL